MKKFLNVVACVALLGSFSQNVFAACTDGGAPNVDWSRCDKSSTPGKPLNLRDLNLHNASLRGTDFSYSDLSKTYLNSYGDANTKFLGAIMDKAYFSSGENKHAEFKGSNFKMASLVEASLYAAHIENANFTGANLTNAKLNSFGDGADFTDAILTNADFGSGSGFAEFNSAKFIRADLTGAYLGRGYFKNADFTDANLTGADLHNIDKTGATFTRAILNNAIWVDGTTCKVPSIGRCNN